MKINYDSLESAVIRKGYLWFDDDSIEFNLNIVGIRATARVTDIFNDALTLSWKYKGIKNCKVYQATTDPGLHWLQKLLNPKGCAILVPGQYVGAYGLRLHREKYEALCQTWGPVKVYRDKNRDSTIDFEPNTITAGDYGINIHKGGTGITAKVGAHSAGCQVFAKESDFLEARDYWRKSRENFGNRFTYTLLEEADFS